MTGCTIRSILGWLVVVAILTVPASADGVGKGGEVNGGGRRSDSAVYASIMGVGEVEAARRLELQRLAGTFEVELRAAAPDIFAGLWIEHQPEFSIEVRFTDVYRGREVVDALRTGPLEGVAVNVDWAEISLADLEALQERAMADARAARVPVDVDIDVRTQRIELRTTDLTSLEGVLAAFAARHPNRLDLVAVDGLARPDQLQPLRGGRPFWGCTTGFTVRNSVGSPGVLTAAHCGNSQIYEDTWQTLPFRGEIFGGSHDVQWHGRACNMTVPNEFDSGIGIRQVTGTMHRDQQVVDSMVCRNGMTTSYRCGFIRSKNFRPGGPNYPGSWNSTFIRVGAYASTPSPFSAGGDSGGPWFLETVAYGIHSGRLSDDPLGDRFYTAINYVSNLGVSVLTAHGGTGPLTSNISCNGAFTGSTLIGCFVSPQGGVPPYSYLWNYSGAATSWSSSGNSAWADYDWPGCPEGGPNLFSVQFTDSCGQSSGIGLYEECVGSGTCEIPPCQIE